MAGSAHPTALFMIYGYPRAMSSAAGEVLQLTAGSAFDKFNPVIFSCKDRYLP